MSHLSNEDFTKIWEKYGNPTLVAQVTGINVRNVHARRKRLGLEKRVDLRPNMRKADHLGRIDIDVQDGVVIVFSDCHYLPGEITTAHRALLSMIRQLKPVAVILNGDAFDGGAISRYPRIGWDKKPSVKEELDACQDRLGEVLAACKDANCVTKIWNIGNHDARYETRLAAAAPEFEGILGFTLKDHFPEWHPAYITWINGEVAVTHFYHTGLHATSNNLWKGGAHYVTSHTHAAQVRPWTTGKGETLWALDTGTIADSLGAHNVDYQQGRHGNHRSGFGVLTFRDGQLLQPELVLVYDEDSVEFRGHVLNADDGKVI